MTSPIMKRIILKFYLNRIILRIKESKPTEKSCGLPSNSSFQNCVFNFVSKPWTFELSNSIVVLIFLAVHGNVYTYDYWVNFLDFYRIFFWIFILLSKYLITFWYRTFFSRNSLIIDFHIVKYWILSLCVILKWHWML